MEFLDEMQLHLVIIYLIDEYPLSIVMFVVDRMMVRYSMNVCDRIEEKILYQMNIDLKIRY